MEKEKKVYGTYGTDISVIKHSAVASWSGFVYQGLCGLHYVLQLLNSDLNKVKNWKLNYESYEDFSILDENDKIISLHQCKCVNSPKDYTAECQKMRDKEDYWRTAEPNLSVSFKGLFFHTNQSNTYSCKIKSYDYDTANKLCCPTDIQKLIIDEIKNFSITNRCPGSCLSKSYRLTSLVSNHIETLHQLQMNTKRDMFEITRTKSIAFKQIIDELAKDDERLFPEEIAITCRHYMEMSMRMRLLTCPKVYGTKVNDFLIAFNLLDKKSLCYFVCRLFPDIDMTSNNADICIRSIERADSLFNVINDVDNQLDLNTLDWKNNIGATETPSTLGSNKYPEEFCSAIIGNPKSSDIRRDYNWIVGDIKYKIENIDQSAGSITQPGDIEIDHEDITQPRKIGLLDIKTKNNGNY